MYLLPVTFLAELFFRYIFIFFRQIKKLPVSSGQISGNPPHYPKAQCLKTSKNWGCVRFLNCIVLWFIRKMIFLVCLTSWKINQSIMQFFILFYFFPRAGTAHWKFQKSFECISSVHRVKSPRKMLAWRRKMIGQRSLQSHPKGPVRLIAQNNHLFFHASGLCSHFNTDFQYAFFYSHASHFSLW